MFISFKTKIKNQDRIYTVHYEIDNFTGDGFVCYFNIINVSTLKYNTVTETFDVVSSVSMNTDKWPYSFEGSKFYTRNALGQGYYIDMFIRNDPVKVNLRVSLPYYFEINDDTTVLAIYFAN